jgi:hypothetical protein
LPAFVIALMVHGVIGGTDVVLNHELIARLPSKPNAGPEQQLHCARELLFAAIFVSLAWLEWHGQFAWWIVALFLAELVVSTRDTVIEGDTRILPPTERVAHVFLFVNLGVVMTLLTQSLIGWHALPTAVVAAHYGWASWVMSAMAAGSLGWAVRDGLNLMQRARGQLQAS